MKYFFLTFAILAALFIGLMPMRGAKSPNTPIRLFPDMDDQDKVNAQEPNLFFADGQGARLPVAGTQPLGFNDTGKSVIGGIPEPEFGGGAGYLATGVIDDYYGSGMPEELGLTAENVGAFLQRGDEAYQIHCAICHGESGDGMGITGQYGVPGIANLVGDLFLQDVYPDGRMFDVISNGKGQMGPYRHNIVLRDRWAIIGYVRALQTARKVPYAAVKEAFDQGIAAQPQ